MAARRHTRSNDNVDGSRRGITPRAAALIAAVLVLLVLAACGDATTPAQQSNPHAGMGGVPTPAQGASMTMSDHGTVVEFTLKTGLHNGNMVFIGSGGNIEGVVNPELHVGEGDLVKLTLVNGDAAEHDRQTAVE